MSGRTGLDAAWNYPPGWYNLLLIDTISRRLTDILISAAQFRTTPLRSNTYVVRTLTGRPVVRQLYRCPEEYKTETPEK